MSFGKPPGTPAWPHRHRHTVRASVCYEMLWSYGQDEGLRVSGLPIESNSRAELGQAKEDCRLLPPKNEHLRHVVGCPGLTDLRKLGALSCIHDLPCTCLFRHTAPARPSRPRRAGFSLRRVNLHVGQKPIFQSLPTKWRSFHPAFPNKACPVLHSCMRCFSPHVALSCDEVVKPIDVAIAILRPSTDCHA